MFSGLILSFNLGYFVSKEVFDSLGLTLEHLLITLVLLLELMPTHRIQTSQNVLLRLWNLQSIEISLLIGCYRSIIRFEVVHMLFLAIILFKWICNLKANSSLWPDMQVVSLVFQFLNVNLAILNFGKQILKFLNSLGLLVLILIGEFPLAMIFFHISYFIL